jgi:hypothetical protein
MENKETWGKKESFRDNFQLYKLCIFYIDIQLVTSMYARLKQEVLLISWGAGLADLQPMGSLFSSRFLLIRLSPLFLLTR